MLESCICLDVIRRTIEAGRFIIIFSGEDEEDVCVAPLLASS